MLFFKLIFPATVFVLFSASGTAQGQDLKVKIAAAGAKMAGYNYQSYEFCGASSADLDAIKALDHQKFSAAGAAYDSSFAAGVADSISKRNNAISQLGEAKFKSSTCPNTLKALQEKLAGK